MFMIVGWPSVGALSKRSETTDREANKNRKEQETEPNRPNRTEPSNFGTGRNQTRDRTEPNQTETWRVQKAQAQPHRSRKKHVPNRTEPNRCFFLKKVRNRNESNRTGSFLWLLCLVVRYRLPQGNRLCLTACCEEARANLSLTAHQPLPFGGHDFKWEPHKTTPTPAPKVH